MDYHDATCLFHIAALLTHLDDASVHLEDGAVGVVYDLAGEAHKFQIYYSENDYHYVKLQVR